MLAPIVLFVYNRPWHTRQTVEALLANELANESDLIIFADGAKSDKDIDAVKEVREYIHSITGFKSITINEQEANLGLANSVIAGVTKVVNEFGIIIVLEDDMVTSPYFLKYMNDALEMYKDEDKVISIHGYMYPVKEQLPEIFFLCNPSCWGWATWKHGWSLFESDGSKLLSAFKTKEQKERFDFNNSFFFYKMLEDQVKGKIDSWAIRWYASAFLNDKLTLWCGKSLLQNIGMDSSGSHCGNQEKEFGVGLFRGNLVLEKILPEELEKNRDCFSRYLKTIKIPFMKRCICKIKYILTS